MLSFDHLFVLASLIIDRRFEGALYDSTTSLHSGYLGQLLLENARRHACSAGRGRKFRSRHILTLAEFTAIHGKRIALGVTSIYLLRLCHLEWVVREES